MPSPDAAAPEIVRSEQVEEPAEGDEHRWGGDRQHAEHDEQGDQAGTWRHATVGGPAAEQSEHENLLLEGRGR